MMISVIIPAYNSERYISEAIDSVLEQTYKDYEIIVIDDGSFDNTRQCVAKYGDKVRYIYQANKGLAGARNTGIRASQGSYLQFLDADDILLPEKLEKQINFLEKNYHYDVCYSNYMFFKDNNRSKTWKTERYRPSGDIFYALIKDIFINVHTLLIRAASLKKVGLFDESLSAVEDWDFWLRMAYSGARFYFMDEVLCLYRQHEGTLSKKRDLIMQNKIRVIENASKKMIPKKVRKRLGVKYQLCHYHWLLGREYIKDCRYPKALSEIIRYHPICYFNRVGLRISGILERIFYGKKISPELSKIEAFLITIGERTEIEAYNSIKNQSMPVNKITVLRDIKGIHNSLNAMQEKISSEYVLKVDADMLLKRNCVRNLYNILNKNPELYGVQGYLKDPFLGKVWGIHMFRSSHVKDYRYKDTIGTDAEFEREMERKGYREIKHKRLLGLHKPEYTLLEIKQKFIREGEKIIFFRDTTRLESNIKHLMKFIKRNRTDAFSALVYMWRGLVRRGTGEKDSFCYNQEQVFDEKEILKKAGVKDISDRKSRIGAADSVVRKCYEVFNSMGFLSEADNASDGV